jgi:hypothetical protein
MKLKIQIPILTIAAFLLQACSTIAPFNETAYKMSTSLKVDSLTLIDKATETYTLHEKEVSELNAELSKAYEYAKSRPQNNESTCQWSSMIDPNKHLMGGFLKKWENDQTLKPNFIKEAKQEISQNFDRISELESGKNKTN